MIESQTPHNVRTTSPRLGGLGGQSLGRPFHLRAYAKSELAQLYFPATVSPDTATAHLRQWIRRNRELSTRLTALGYLPTDKFFTPRQVATIVEILGEP